MAMVGGTTSVVTGGKFENGAASAAFVHLFNGESISKAIKFGKHIDKTEDIIKQKSALQSQMADGNISAYYEDRNLTQQGLDNLFSAGSAGAEALYGYMIKGLSIGIGIALWYFGP